MKTVLVLGALVCMTACGQTGTTSPTPTPTPTAPPTSTPTPSPSATTACWPLSGGSAGTGNITDVSVEQTSGHDRLVVQLDSGILSYVLKSNPNGTNFITTFSGMPFTVAGSYGVELQISGVDLHDQYAHGMDLTPGYSVLKEVRVRGDGEGRADIAIGLSGNVCPTISSLTGPTRLVIDFPTG